MSALYECPHCHKANKHWIRLYTPSRRELRCINCGEASLQEQLIAVGPGGKKAKKHAH